jgi:uncharacterized protein DUF6445
MFDPGPRIDVARLRALPYVRPKEGRDYWVIDGALHDPDAVRQRNVVRTDFVLGFPHRKEGWPGMRATDALTREELAPIERRIRQETRSRSLFQPDAPEGTRLDHNILQVVGRDEAGARPHTDSRRLCRYAAVLYLNPSPEPGGGTSFFRLKFPDGSLGGNTVEAPHVDLAAAVGVRKLPAEAWAEEVAIENVYNRLLFYRANLVHSASRYFGTTLEDKRMTAVFFWMAKP